VAKLAIPLVTAVVCLAGCDQRPAAAPTPPQPRWTITAAEHAAAWRLDTQTGDLDFCYFTPADGLKCTQTLGVTPRAN
jgi:hypothetical protein